jgi:hypothetical protein
MISSDTAGAVKFTAPHEVVVVELVALAVEVELKVVEARKRRKEEGRAAATATALRASHPPSPLPAVRRRCAVVAGQVVAVFPGSVVDTEVLTRSMVLLLDTRTFARVKPWLDRQSTRSHLMLVCTKGVRLVMDTCTSTEVDCIRMVSRVVV